MPNIFPYGTGEEGDEHGQQYRAVLAEERRDRELAEARQAVCAHRKAYPQLTRAYSAAVALNSDGRGWSRLGGTPTKEAPRNDMRWNKREDADLAEAHSVRGVPVAELARLHGRTYIAIEMRLSHLGLNDPADNFREPTKEKTVKMTPNRLMTLFAVYRGTYENELNVGTSGPDLASLVAEGLVTVNGDGRRPSVTEDGSTLVDSLLGRSSTSGGATSTSWNASRNTSALDDQRFFLVSSGDAMKGGPHGRPQLKKPPTTVQSSYRDAEREASRLADLSRGEKFFVLQAVSVHEVQPAPAKSRRL